MDAPMLKDIGVTSAEAEREANKPFWHLTSALGRRIGYCHDHRLNEFALAKLAPWRKSKI
jgi:hypothetical protein